MRPSRLTRSIGWILNLLALCAIAGYSARSARAQFIGYTSPQSVTQTVFTNQSTPTTVTITNLGQTVHFLSYTTTGTVTQMTLRIEASNDGSVFFPISNDAVIMSGNPAPGVIYAAGYYPVLRVNLAAIVGGGSVSAQYSGASASPAPPEGSVKALFSHASMGSNSSINIPVPYSSTGGWLYVCSEGGSFPANSTIGISSTFLTNYFLDNVGGLNCPGVQILPGEPTQVLTASFSSGGASANFFDAYVIFTQFKQISAQALYQGFNNNGLIAEKGARWSATAAPAAGTQATITKAGGTSAYHVIDCISYSAGAITAPVATALTVQLLNNATAIWSKTIDIPATTGMHVDQNFCGLNLMGGQGFSMTLQFSAGLTNESESVTMTGYDVQ